jgi:hypothetical protein
VTKPLRGERAPIYFIDDAPFLPLPNTEIPMTKPFTYWPDTGKVVPKDHSLTTASDFREQEGKTAWLYNPWTGTLRDARDVGSDPFGYLIEPPANVFEQQQPHVDHLVKALANRFLGWPLPEGHVSDGCVTIGDYQFPRSGTNLLDAQEAEEMFRYVLDGYRQVVHIQLDENDPAPERTIEEVTKELAAEGQEYFPKGENAPTGLQDWLTRAGFSFTLEGHPKVTPEVLLLAMLPDDLTPEQKKDLVEKVFMGPGVGVGADADCFKRIARAFGWTEGNSDGVH